VTTHASPKLAAYATVAAVFLLGGPALGRPELVAFGAPFLLFLVVGLSISGPPDLSHLSVSIEPDRVVEGETVMIRVEIGSERDIARLDLLFPLERGLAVEGGPLRSLDVPSGTRRRIELPILCDRWGAFRPGRLLFRAYDRFDLLRFDGAIDARRPLKVFPRSEAVRELVRPMRTQLYVGNHVARHRGEGIEFAELRPFVPGDRVRSIDWRATARMGAPWVRDRHPERNADVVLFLDTFSDVRTGGPWSTLERAVRASSAIAEIYLARRDRVGLVSFGGVLRWLEPGMGSRHRYRIIDALLGSEINASFAWKGVEVIPHRTLPPSALVIAVTPLLDERSVTALFDLRGRRYDLAVIEVSPVPRRSSSNDGISDLAHRFWLLEREMLRGRLEGVGVAVAAWPDERSLFRAFWELETFRRQVRLAPA
jgi:uncharacterized protein (DUF58 family)